MKISKQRKEDLLVMLYYLGGSCAFIWGYFVLDSLLLNIYTALMMTMTTGTALWYFWRAKSLYSGM
jgi:uncharacterized membrane protein YedE/YeeE